MIGWLQSHSSLHGNLHGFYSAQWTERNQYCECVYAIYFNYLCSLYQSHTPELDWAPKPLQMNEDSTRGRMNLHLFGGWNCRVVTWILNLRYLTQLLFPVRIHPSLSSSQEVSFIFTLKKVLWCQTQQSWHKSQVPSASLQTHVRCQCLLCSHRGLFISLTPPGFFTESCTIQEQGQKSFWNYVRLKLLSE